MPVAPVVAVFGRLGVALRSAPGARHEAQALDTRCHPDDRDLAQILATERPVVLVSFGEITAFPRLLALPFDLRRRWLHFPADADLAHVGEAAFRCLVTDASVPRPAPPLVSVITPTYRTGRRLVRPHLSLLAQTWGEWEWVIVDDSDDDGETWRAVSALAQADPRISAFRAHRHSGIIGEVKRQAARLARGAILVELDHDDALVPSALADIVGAFRAHPEAGFAYSDCAETFEAGGWATYPPGWGWGYGGSYTEVYQGRACNVLRSPLVNCRTIRHITSAPNHYRAWTAEAYHAAGGHSPLLHVADDYDLIVRTFLTTRMIRVERLGYVQFYNRAGNTQHARNADIQRMVRALAESYDRRIYERFRALDVEDWAWNPARGCSDWSRPAPPDAPHATIRWSPPGSGERAVGAP